MNDVTPGATYSEEESLSTEASLAPEPSNVVAPGTLDSLAGQLVWRIGRLSDDSPVTVRVGLPSAAAAFADLPKLRTATEAELKEAIDTNTVKVEWIAAKGRS